MSDAGLSYVLGTFLHILLTKTLGIIKKKKKREVLNMHWHWNLHFEMLYTECFCSVK